MCRWLAYSGSPILLEDLLLKPTHSLIDQSLHSRLGATTTNGDGFGIGWYGDGERPASSAARARLEQPKPDGAAPVTSSRRSSSRTSAPPPAAPSRRPTAIRSVTAAGFGCTTASSASSHCEPRSHVGGRPLPLHRDRGHDRLGAVVLPGAHLWVRERSTHSGRARGRPHREKTGREHGIDHPIQMTVCTTDGASVWAFRYSSEGSSRSLFYSTRIDSLRAQYPDNPVLPRSPTRRGSSSPSRSAISKAPGTRYPNPATAWSSRDRTS